MKRSLRFINLISYFLFLIFSI